MAFQRQLRLVGSRAALFQQAADEFTRRALAAVVRNGRCTVALSGGSTPKGLYSLLATSGPSGLPWDRMFFFWGDQRHVPPGGPRSNYRPALEGGGSRGEHLSHCGRDPNANLRKLGADTPQLLPPCARPVPRLRPDSARHGTRRSRFPDSMALAEKARFRPHPSRP